MPLWTALQEYLTVRSQNSLKLGGDGNVGTGYLGVRAADGNDLGGIRPQLPRMVVDVEVG